MQLRKIALAALTAAPLIGWALLSATTASTMGCGGGGGGGGGDTFCSSNANCTTSEICHPIAKICVQTCTAGSDCPSSAKNCDFPAGTSSGTKVCNCATTALCSGGSTGSSLVCNTQSKVCEVKCTNDSGCASGRKCNTTSGECEAGGAATCTPACATGKVCDNGACVDQCKQGTCAAGKVCNFSDGKCETPATCTAANPQPGGCGYGLQCNAGTCAEVAKPTCAQFTTSSHGSSFGVGKTGPIVWNFVKEAYAANSGRCAGAPGPNLYRAKVEAYDPSGTKFPAGSCMNNPQMGAGANEQAMQGLIHLVDSTGNEIAITNTVNCVGTSTDKKNTTFYIAFCAQSTTGYTAAVHFVDGNESCVTISAN